jgi:hypothetical protein
VTDAELKTWWPALGVVVAALRHSNQSTVADLLIDAVSAGETSSEILDGVGVALRQHGALRSTLDEPAVQAWNAVLAEVHRAFPGSGLVDWLVGLTRPSG